MLKPKVLGGKTVKAGHLRRYVKEANHKVESRQPADRITTGATIPSESKPAINCILGGQSDSQYKSRRR